MLWKIQDWGYQYNVQSANKISSSFEIFSSELERIKQLFVNNNYPMKVTDGCANKLNTNNNNLDNKQAIKLFYKIKRILIIKKNNQRCR